MGEVEAGAGIGCTRKVVMEMKYKEVGGWVDWDKLNGNIDFEERGF
ncbi:hypothetical protein [Bacillus velezensis]|nr:hypothetical protein [Bacillus velezensis]